MKRKPTMYLEKMTAKELRALRDRIDAAIVNQQAADKQRLRDEFRQMAFEAGTTLDEIVGGRKSKREKSGFLQPVANARWRDPVTGVTWSGRGRHPAKFDRARAVACDV